MKRHKPPVAPLPEPAGKQLSFGGFKPTTTTSSGPARSRAGSPAFKQVQQRLRAITREVEEIAKEIIGGEYKQTEILIQESPKEHPKMAAVMWGALVSQWVCDYGCKPVQLTRGLTHKFDCPYWENEGKTQTPIDRMKPPEE